MHVDGVAGVLRVAGRYEDAESLYLRAIGHAERHLGSGHPETLALLNNLAVLYKVWGRFDEAHALYQLAFMLAGSAGDDRALATLYHDLGGLEHARGRDAEAEELYQRALRLFEQSVPADHPHAVTCASHYAHLLRQSGREHDAERLDRQYGGALPCDCRTDAINDGL
jgi:tetratricopeptide (TPR) repeat protein